MNPGPGRSPECLPVPHTGRLVGMGDGGQRDRAHRSNRFHACLPALPAVLGGPWCVDASLPFLPLTHRALPCVSPCLLSSSKDTSRTLLQHDLHMTDIIVTSAKTLFPNKVTFTGARG